MNILDEAARQNREIVTRDGRKPWYHDGGNGRIAAGIEGDCWWNVDIVTGRGNPTYEHPNDLILAPKKATIWYWVRDGAVGSVRLTPPDNAAEWRTVEVDL